MTTMTVTTNSSASRLGVLGMRLSVLGTALILGWIGAYKFTPTEAKAIQPLVSNSPLFSWMTSAFGVQGTSSLIGLIEIITALLMCCVLVKRIPFQRAAYIGGIIGVVIFLGTLSFLATTPGSFSLHDGMWVPNGFLLKDIVLLGASVLCAAEAATFLNRQERKVVNDRKRRRFF
jgi:reactive chlorine resistance protein C